MGFISRFNLERIKKETGICRFVETGTWYGDATFYALTFGYNCQTCELNEKLHFIASDRFKGNQDVILYLMASEKFLTLSEYTEPVVYWLDAHLPELYTHHESAKGFSKEISLPLEKELSVIESKDNFAKSIIIIDDVRMYHDEHRYTGGNIPKQSNFDLIKYCLAKYSETHTINFSRLDQGYLVIIPIGVEREIVSGIKFV